MPRKGLRDFLTQQKIKSLLERYNNRYNLNISQLSRVIRDRDLTLHYNTKSYTVLRNKTSRNSY